MGRWIKIGVYDKGQKEGIGIYEWGDGSKYQGQLSDNEITGWGTLTDDEGTYTGEFFENAQHGHGEWHYSNGDIFIGQFQKSLRHGQGKLQWVSEGKEYDGQWREGVPWGQGKIVSNGIQKDV